MPISLVLLLFLWLAAISSATCRYFVVRRVSVVKLPREAAFLAWARCRTGSRVTLFSVVQLS